MKRAVALVTLAVPIVAGLWAATPASAKPVWVEHDGACWHVYVNDQDVTFEGICYLGPPPPK
ncbi:MAG: hypothetical protein ABR520_12515 [Mycobacteriales bacterium]|nr:hypothetical protein [Frankia sp.]